MLHQAYKVRGAKKHLATCSAHTGPRIFKADMGECEDSKISDSLDTCSKKRKDTSSGEFFYEVINDISSLKRAQSH